MFVAFCMVKQVFVIDIKMNYCLYVDAIFFCCLF